MRGSPSSVKQQLIRIHARNYNYAKGLQTCVPNLLDFYKKAATNQDSATRIRVEIRKKKKKRNVRKQIAGVYNSRKSGNRFSRVNLEDFLS